MKRHLRRLSDEYSITTKNGKPYEIRGDKDWLDDYLERHRDEFEVIDERLVANNRPLDVNDELTMNEEPLLSPTMQFGNPEALPITNHHDSEPAPMYEAAVLPTIDDEAPLLMPVMNFAKPGFSGRQSLTASTGGRAIRIADNAGTGDDGPLQAPSWHW